MCYARSSIRSTIDRYKKACSDDSNFGTVTEINAQLALKYKVPNKNLTSPITCDPWKQYYQQESAKLRQQIQMLQNSNRHLMGDSLSSLTVKELRNWRTGLSEEIELENESVCLRSKIAQMERFQQANMVTGQELNAIHALASRNFFSSAIIEGGGTAYSHPDKKILYLG
ncbi:Agamous-like MADS-box protein AGL11 [Citrus sinensis]|nr:Agamous-like MADS-box protein AGL11 [Citrus sinensis]